MLKFFQKLIITIIASCFLITGAYFYYRHNHPKYVPLPPRPEITITIIPGWDLRDVAKYLVKIGLASSTEQVYQLVGEPATDYRLKKNVVSTPDLQPDPDWQDLMLKNKPGYVSYEGYLAPETYRVYQDASLSEVVDKLMKQRAKEFLDNYYASSNSETFKHNIYEVLTMASILEREVRNLEDKKLVADIFWRRLKKNWALQADSTVHYAVAKEGNVFTSSKDRQVDSLWNTYKYPGLPPSPICNPGLDSIKAALTPTKNDYWYFLTDKQGVVYYAKTLEEQNLNKYKYL